MALSSVSISPLTARLSFVPGTEHNTGDIVDILTLGSTFHYIIPSFNVLRVELRQMKVAMIKEGVDTMLDLFVRNDPALCRSYPAKMTIKDFLVVDIWEFSICVKTDGLKLPRDGTGVMVVWEFEWTNDETATTESEDDDNPSSSEHYNSQLHSESETSDEADVENQPTLPSQTNTVTFKCIGCTRSNEAQITLSKVVKTMRDGSTVPVRIKPEPENQYDSKAITFQCYVDGKWAKIGYIVKECLEQVHMGLRDKKILTVKLAWAKYLICWSYSGPGYYAGVDITIRGEWDRVVIHAQSTH